VASGLALLVVVTAQRIYELRLARRNTQRLLAAGAHEVGRGHYPAMVALHATWLITLWVFGWNRSLVLPFVALYLLLQVGRVWVLRTLGPRWTTRIIILPGAPRVTAGPFRFFDHPNYVVVALELPCVSLALGLWLHAFVFGMLNLAMLSWRIRVENNGLLS
jgi:methyltransferase